MAYTAGVLSSRVALGAALVAWLAFFALFGVPGFNLREDGYLLTLAARMLAGEVPYRDFAYIRPPLPLVLPVALLTWAPAHAVLAARLWVAFQTAAILTVGHGLLSAVGVPRGRAAVLALAGALLACTGGVPPAPWHTVDGVFFSTLAVAAVAAVMADRRPAPVFALAAGMAAAAASLSKQGFVVVAAAGLAWSVTAGRRIGRRPWSAGVAYVAGMAVVTIPVVLWLGAAGAAGAAYQAIVVDPRELTREVLRLGPWDLLVGLELPSAAGTAVGLALGLVCVPGLSPRLALALGAAVMAGMAAVFWASRSIGQLVWEFILEPSYALAWIGGMGLLVAHLGRWRRLPAPMVWPLVLALSTLYGSAWSYVGVRSAAFALALVLPLVIGLAGMVASPGHEWTAPAGVAALGARARPAVVCVSALALLSVAAQLTTHLHYTAAFLTPGLLGIRSTADRVRSVDEVVALIRQETGPGDPVLALPDLPALYLLTGRPNPTRVDWLIPQELTQAEIRRALADLERRPPRLVVVTDRAVFGYGHRRLLPVLAYVTQRYELAVRAGELDVYRRREAPTS